LAVLSHGKHEKNEVSLISSKSNFPSRHISLQDDLDGAIASLDNSSAAASQPSSKPTTPLEDGDGKYNLVGIISHIGENTGSGHYVAHLKKDGRWVIFNDEKVALSENPPIRHAYMYLFQRSDTVGAPHSEY
jgi:ubiquitin carboxyl-terminal hydrolase 5/13